MRPPKSREDAEEWLRINAPHLTITQWGGSWSAPSVFTHSSGDWKIPMKVLKRRYVINPNTCLGQGHSSLTKSREEFEEDLQRISVHIRLKEWGGRSGKVSTFVDTRTGVVFSRMGSSLLRELRLYPTRSFGAGRGGANKRTNEDYQTESLNRYSDRFEVLEFRGKEKSLFLDKETGKEFLYYHTSLLSSLQRNAEFVPGSPMSSLETLGRTMIPEGVEFDVNKIIGNRRPDVLFPKHKLVVEFDGLFWHSEPRRDSKYHYNKKEAYTLAGYDSLFFREDELISKLPVCSAILRRRLGSIPAVTSDKCDVVELDGPRIGSLTNEEGEWVGLVHGGEEIASLQFHRAGTLVTLGSFLEQGSSYCSNSFMCLFKHMLQLSNPDAVVKLVDRRFEHHLMFTPLMKRVGSTFNSFLWTDFNKTSHDPSELLGNTKARIWDCGKEFLFWKSGGS